MKLKDYIALNRQALENEILSYLEAKQQEFSDKSLYLDSTNKIIETVTGGKLIRGLLVLLAYDSKMNKISDDALKLATAIELIHTGLIIHDDIMDNDQLRRGKPTVFSQAIRDGERSHADNPKEYGNAVAICIGDLTFFMAHELIGGIKDESHGLRILRIVSQELQKVGYAQISDIHFGINKAEPSEEEIVALYRLKTARYSFSLPLKIGGILAGYDSQVIEKFEKFGEAVGIAFQIKDDELGIFGKENVLGKSLGSDIRENKKTLIRHMLINSADKIDKKYLLGIFGKNTLTKKDVLTVGKYMKKYNVVELVREIREEKANEAKKILHDTDLPGEYKSVFLDLVNFTNNRDK